MRLLPPERFVAGNDFDNSSAINHFQIMSQALVIMTLFKKHFVFWEYPSFRAFSVELTWCHGFVSSPPYPNADCDKNAGCTHLEMNIVGTTNCLDSQITYQKVRYIGDKPFENGSLWYPYDILWLIFSQQGRIFLLWVNIFWAKKSNFLYLINKICSTERPFTSTMYQNSSRAFWPNWNPFSWKAPSAWDHLIWGSAVSGIGL